MGLFCLMILDFEGIHIHNIFLFTHIYTVLFVQYIYMYIFTDKG